MQIVNVTICALVVLSLTLAPANAHDLFAAEIRCDSAADASCDCPECSCQPVDGDPWKLFGNCSWLDHWGITVGGQIQQGFTTNSRNPANPPIGSGNTPATLYNYRNDEYMLDQVLLTAKRKADSGGCGWAVGGHMDLVYGTDYIFLQSRGLETNRDFSNRWNSSDGVGFGGNGLTGLALPQLYLEVAYNDLTFTLGHFYEPLGYERPVSTDNFYYSTTYGYNFSFETSQVTGLMAQWQANDQWSFTGGFHRGMLNWEDNNNDLNGFGGFTWVAADKDASLQFLFDLGEENNAGTALRYLHSITFSKEIGDRWSYVIHSDLGVEQEAAAGGQTAYWYNVVQWLAYQIDECWTVGLRYEWFDDIDGVAVMPTPGPGIYHDITLGLNYNPNANVTIRPEVRWDWFDSDTGVGPGPFGNGTRRSQFMMAVDLIYSF